MSKYQIKSITIVDDDRGDALYLRKALERARPGVEVKHIIDSEEAMRVLPNLENNLIFLDINMPGYNGFQVLERLRTERKGSFPPVVMFTSSALDEDIEAAFSRYASSFASKPSTMPGYLSFAQKCIDYWMSEERPTLN